MQGVDNPPKARPRRTAGLVVLKKRLASCLLVVSRSLLRKSVWWLARTREASSALRRACSCGSLDLGRCVPALARARAKENGAAWRRAGVGRVGLWGGGRGSARARLSFGGWRRSWWHDDEHSAVPLCPRRLDVVVAERSA